MEILIGLVVVLLIGYAVKLFFSEKTRCPACGAAANHRRIPIPKHDNETTASLMGELNKNFSIEDQWKNMKYTCSQCGEIFMRRFAEQGERDLRQGGEKFALDHYNELKKLM